MAELDSAPASGSEPWSIQEHSAERGKGGGHRWGELGHLPPPWGLTGELRGMDFVLLALEPTPPPHPHLSPAWGFKGKQLWDTVRNVL